RALHRRAGADLPRRPGVQLAAGGERDGGRVRAGQRHRPAVRLHHRHRAGEGLQPPLRAGGAGVVGDVRHRPRAPAPLRRRHHRHRPGRRQLPAGAAHGGVRHPHAHLADGGRAGAGHAPRPPGAAGGHDAPVARAAGSEGPADPHRPPGEHQLLSWVATIACAVMVAQTPGYEQQLVTWGLEKTQREVEPAPEGKRVEEILVASEDIVARSDPYPQLLNLVHVRTREPVVRAEVLLRVGEPYTAQLAAETERNLRKLFILATAVVLPVKARAPDAVSVLVITKDLWSIRLNSEFSLVEGTLLQLLRIRPTEQNFLGLNKRVSLDFFLKLDTVSLGEVLVDERFLGTGLRLVQDARVILNRQSGAVEGSQGEAAVQLPLRTLDSTYGYQVRAAWLVQRARVFRGASVSQLPYPSVDAPEALLPYVYAERSLSGSASYTWSFGHALKANVTPYVAGFVERAAAPAEE